MSTAGYPTITIDLVLDRLQTKEVLRAVLHSILFHRLFGTVKPRTFEVLDVTMPGVDDDDITRQVEEKIDAFWRGVEGVPNKRGQIVVTFSEKRPRKSWFLMGEEEIPWEQWIINAEIRQPSDRERQKFNADLAATLTKSLQTMLVHSSSEKGRSAVPLITNATSISPFPIKMAVKVGGVEVA
ncbi:autophagy-related protein [Trametes polyzona]|nr:autophagy-related protein [Trametes polyzona]